MLSTTKDKNRFLRIGQHGISHSVVLFLLIIIFCSFGVVRLNRSHVSADSPKIKSAINGYCLDDYLDSSTNNSPVDIWTCNNSFAQVWHVNTATITHDNRCLSVVSNGTKQGDQVVLSSCSQQPGQVWVGDKNGFENPNSGKCLAVSSVNIGSNLEINSCSDLSSNLESWAPDAANITNSSCGGSESSKVACFAIKEWSTWQSGQIDHETLLNKYTSNTPYEEWCADFVSYVYKEAGYPFSGGETNGWDENLANNIQNRGFTIHPVSSGYMPNPGDVAFFDYNGGHVEIVISGGKNPTFIYGNSATIDPTTNNGQMMANTITSDGSQGQLLYYLSPH